MILQMKENKIKKTLKKNNKPVKELLIPKVMVTPSVIDTIKKETLKYGSFETGGLLIGEKALLNDEYVITVKKATGPGNNSQHSTHQFIPDIAHFKKEMRTELYRNGIIYLGEWHKHPGSFDEPSMTDLNTMKEITRDDNTKDIIAVIATKPDSIGGVNGQNMVKVNFYYYQRGMKNFVSIVPEIVSITPLKKKLKKIQKINMNIEFILRLFEKGMGSMLIKGDLKDSGVLNVILTNKHKKAVTVEIVFDKNDDKTFNLNPKSDVIVNVSIKNKKITAAGWQMDDNNGEFNKVEVELIDLKDSLFKRLGGLGIQEKILNKKIVMVGLGSVGSTATAQLVKAGIENLVLIDPDQLEVHNIIRHLCDFDDLGRYKTNAVADRIKKINPNLDITLLNNDIVHDLNKIEKDIKDADMLIVSTDTPDSRQVANMIAIENKIPAVFISLYERAMTGSVYRVAYNKTGCRNCIGEGQWNAEFAQGKMEYSEALNERDIIFQPGMDSDISLVTLLGVKMALSSLQNPRHKILPDMGANFIRWDGYPGKKGSMVQFISKGIPINKNCDICGNRKVSNKNLKNIDKRKDLI